MEIYIDTKTATWGDSEDLRFANVSDEQVEALDGLSDSELRSWAESHAEFVPPEDMPRERPFVGERLHG